MVRALAAVGLLGVGALHAAWAAGSSWPARDRRTLAEAVVGSPAMPPAAACAVVAIGTGAAGALVAGVGAQRRLAIAARRAAGLALIGRGLAGGIAAGRMLRLPSPNARFRHLDARYYRPLCCALGLATLLSSRQRSANRAKSSWH